MADPTALSVEDQLTDLDSRLVQKHGTQLLALADEDATFPDQFFEADTATPALIRPKVLPAAFRPMGYITTDGISESNDVSNTDTNMVQDIEPVRSDIDSMTKTLQVTFGEASGYTKALYAGLRIAEFPADKAAAWAQAYGKRTQRPYYRLLILTQDGVGENAIYRVEFAFRAKVTDLGDRTLNRTDPETTQFTFTCYKDQAVGASKYDASTGADMGLPPSVTAALAAA